MPSVKPSVVWSPRAAADVQRLYRFLRDKNPVAAKRAIQAIRGGVHILTLQARMGRTVEGLPEHFREWPIDFGHSGYLVRYRVDAAAITILAVWHQKEVTGEE